MTEQASTDGDFRAALSEAQIKALRESGAAPGIEIGALAPAFALPDAMGKMISLAERLAQGPVVLSFYRGAWCPYCNRELHDLQGILPDLHNVGAQLIAISPQAPDQSLGLVEKLGLGFDVLSDTDQAVIRSYRLSFDLAHGLRPAYAERGLDLTVHNADGSWSLPVPATFVVDRDGTVRARHLDPNYRERMSPADILQALHMLG